MAHKTKARKHTVVKTWKLDLGGLKVCVCVCMIYIYIHMGGGPETFKFGLYRISDCLRKLVNQSQTLEQVIP